MFGKFVTVEDITADFDKLLKKAKEAKLAHQMEAVTIDKQIVALATKSLAHKDEAKGLEGAIKEIKSLIKKV